MSLLVRTYGPAAPLLVKQVRGLTALLQLWALSPVERANALLDGRLGDA